MSSLASAFPMVKADIALLLPAALSQDVNTIWLKNYSGPMAKLAAAMNPGDTTVSLVSPALQNVVGNTILVDSEPMAVLSQSTDGLTLTVQRYLDAFPYMGLLIVQPSSNHASGASIFLLTYATPFIFMTEHYLRPGVTADVQALGRASYSFGTYASGTMSIYTAPSSDSSTTETSPAESSPVESSPTDSSPTS